jgi:hypothetical protein
MIPDAHDPPKKSFFILFLFFIFYIKISAKGHPVLLFLSFDTIFKNNINNLKHNGIDDPLDNPYDDTSVLDDPLR